MRKFETSTTDDASAAPFTSTIFFQLRKVCNQEPSAAIQDLSCPGYTNGTGSLARFRNASGVCVSQGMIFVADPDDHRIRNLIFNPSVQPVAAANLQLSTYPGLKIAGRGPDSTLPTLSAG